MLSNQETIYAPKTEKFLCFNSKPAQLCCCCCFNVKIGSIIFSFLTLFGYIANLISAIKTGIPVNIIFWVLLLILFVIGVTYLFLSIYQRRADYAYYSYVIFMIDFCLLWIFLIIWIIVISIFSNWFFSYVPTEFRSQVITSYYIFLSIFFILSFTLRLHVLFIFYSFTRYAALGDWNAVNGDFTGFNNNLNIQLNSVVTGSVIPINSNITNQNTNQNFNQSNYKLK